MRLCECGCGKGVRSRFVEGHSFRVLNMEFNKVRKGRTYEEMYGVEKALYLKRCRRNSIKSRPVGKTYEELYGSERAGAIRRKHSLAMLGKKLSPRSVAWRRKRREWLTGRTKENDLGRKAQAEKLKGRTKMTHSYLASVSDKLRGRYLGVNSPRYGKTPTPGKRCWFEVPGQGWVCLRSSWELIVAKYLVAKGVEFIYEKERFVLDGKTFLPDFYLVRENKFWEVKGWLRPLDKQKLLEMSLFHPKVCVELVMDVRSDIRFKEFV